MNRAGSYPAHRHRSYRCNRFYRSSYLVPTVNVSACFSRAWVDDPVRRTADIHQYVVLVVPESEHRPRSSPRSPETNSPDNLYDPFRCQVRLSHTYVRFNRSAYATPLCVWCIAAKLSITLESRQFRPRAATATHLNER